MAVLTGTQAVLEASATLVPLNDRWVEIDTAVVRNGKFFYRYKIGSGGLPYTGLSYENTLTADLTFATCIPLTPPVNPCPGNGCIASFTVNGEDGSDFDPCEKPVIDLLVQDEDGNPLAISFDGTIITVTLVPTFLYYANEAAALADAVTVPTLQQRVVLSDTGREYRSTNGTDTVNVIVAARKFIPELEETGSTGSMELLVPIDGGTNSIQLN